jgi:hypothetical protein
MMQEFKGSNEEQDGQNNLATMSEQLDEAKRASGIALTAANAAKESADAAVMFHRRAFVHGDIPKEYVEHQDRPN